MEQAEPILSDYCYRTLKERIIRGEFSPGEKLRIASLKSLLKAGPTPIREALSRLTSSGLVEAEANRGFFVRKVSENEVRDIYATFSKVELWALIQAIEQGDASWEATVLGALHKLSLIENGHSPVDTSKWLEANYNFHLALVQGCNSPCLLKIREELYQLFDRYCHLGILVTKKPLTLNNQEHCDIAKAAIARDANRASQLLSQHLKQSLTLVIDTLQKTNYS